MSIFKYTTILSLIVQVSQSCNSEKLLQSSVSGGSRPLTSLRSGSNPSEKIPKGSLKFIAGDIISCAIEPARLGSHMMLAVSEHHVMHIPGNEPGRPEDQSRIEYTSFLDAVRDYQVCDVITKNYDDEFKRSCGPKSIRSPEKAIEAAIESFNYYKKTGRFFFFDRLECNCEHWVVSWKYTEWLGHFS